MTTRTILQRASLLTRRAHLSPCSAWQTERPNSGRRTMASQPTVHQKKGDFEYCVDLVQNRDREAYLCGLLMPSSARRSYFAIRAFNVELASIKDSSSMMNRRGADDASSDEGPSSSSFALRIRMQWWRDALGVAYRDVDGNVDGGMDPHAESSQVGGLGSMSHIEETSMRNPVLRVLRDAVNESGLTRRFMERLLEARENDLEVTQLETLQDLKQYAEATSSSLLYLALETTGSTNEEADMCAQEAGVGIGLTMALRSAQFRFVQGECSIPKQMLPSDFPYYKANTEEPLQSFTAEEREQLEHALHTISTEAMHHLSHARDLQRHVPKGSKQCLLPVVPSMMYLSKLDKLKYNMFDPQMLEQERLTMLFQLSRAWLTGVF